MRWYESLQIRVLILLGLGPLFVLVSLLVFWGPAKQVNQSLNNIDDLHGNLQSVTVMRETRRAASSAVVEGVLAGEDTTAKYDEKIELFDTAWRRFASSANASNEKTAEVRRLRSLAITQTGRELLVLSKVREGDISGARDLLTSEYFEQNEQLLEKIHDLAIGESAAMAQMSDRSQEAMTNFFVFYVAMLVAFSLVALLLVFVFIRKFKHRIDGFSDTARAIASGDFSQRVEVKREDELGQFAQSFNRMAQRLETTRSSLSREVETRTRALEDSLRKLSAEEDELEETEEALLNILEDLKQDEQEIKESEERYRSLLETVPVGIVVYEDYKIKYVNQAALEMMGVESASRVMGKNIFDFVADESKANVMRQVSLFEETGEDLDLGEQVFQRKDGTKVPVEAKAVGVMYEGQPAGMTAFIDVSKRKEVQDKLRRLNRLKSRFITALSSVTQAPMEAISWNLDMLLSGDFDHLNPEQKVLVRHALDNKEKIERLIENMRMVLDIERGTMSLDASPVSLSSVVTSVTGGMSDGFKVRDLELYVEIPEEKLPAALIDAHKIRAVLVIFLENAMFYTPEGGRTDVSLRHIDGFLRVEVEDTGIGVPEAEKDDIFTRFFRASNAATMHPEGVGIGLYIAKSIVEAHEGNIGFQSTEGEGSLFWFEVPY
jgi:PAS domain S-box-containing protein